MRKLLTTALCMMFAAPLFALADQPTTRPVTDNPGSRYQRGMGMRGGHGRETAPATQPSEDLNKAMQFMNDWSPNRAKAVQDPTLSDKVKERLQRQIVSKWRNYTLLAEKFPKLAELTLKQIGIEDEVYGLTSGLHHGAATMPSTELQQQVREKVSALVDLDMKEQDMRIDQLEKLLDQEKKTRSEYDKDKQINDRVATFLGIQRRPGGANGEQHGNAANPVDAADAAPVNDPNNPGN